jgi:hypothetical protein
MVGKPDRKRVLGRPRLRWKNNIVMELREIGWKSVYWIHLVLDRDQWQAVVNTAMNLRVPLKARNFLTSSVTVSFLRRTLLHGVS